MSQASALSEAESYDKADRDGPEPGVTRVRPAGRGDVADRIAAAPHAAPAALAASRRRNRQAALFVVSVDCVGLVLAHLIVRTWTSAAFLYDLNVVVAAIASGCYALGPSLAALDHAPSVLRRSLLALVFPLPVIVFANAPRTIWLQAVVATVVLVGCRVASYGTVRRMRRRGWLREGALVIGSGAAASELVSTLDAFPELGLHPVGVVDDFVRDDDDATARERLHRLVTERSVGTVIVAVSTRESTLQILRGCEEEDVTTYVVQRLFDVAAGESDSEIGNVPLHRVRRMAMRRWAWRLKRPIDVVVSLLALVLLAPLMLLIALAIRLSSPGPSIYRQERIGSGGQPFELLKFRSMLPNDDGHATWTPADDEGVTRVGRVLRRTSLDELPQLWNVLRGDMSLVGPRPERRVFVEQFDNSIPGYRDRHRVPGGLTGLAQVRGLRGDSSIEERSRLDNYYIDHWSLWRDAIIVIRSFRAMLHGR